MVQGHFLLINWVNSMTGKAKLLISFQIRGMNNPELREIVMSSVMGTGTARGLAKLFSILASGGSYKGTQLLSPEAIQQLSERMTEGPEVIFQLEDSRVGRGVSIVENPNVSTVKFREINRQTFRMKKVSKNTFLNKEKHKNK